MHEIPSEHVHEWQALNTEDKVIPTVVAEPGRPKTFHAPSLFAGRAGTQLRDFTERAGWQSAMVTAFLDLRHKVLQWLSLYRPDPEHDYKDQEQRLGQFLMPHLVEALTIHRALNMQAVYGDGVAKREFLALCDRQGLLHYADPNFLTALKSDPNGPASTVEHFRRPSSANVFTVDSDTSWAVLFVWRSETEASFSSCAHAGTHSSTHSAHSSDKSLVSWHRDEAITRSRARWGSLRPNGPPPLERHL